MITDTEEETWYLNFKQKRIFHFATNCEEPCKKCLNGKKLTWYFFLILLVDMGCGKINLNKSVFSSVNNNLFVHQCGYPGKNILLILKPTNFIVTNIDGISVYAEWNYPCHKNFKWMGNVTGVEIISKWFVIELDKINILTKILSKLLHKI